MYREVDRCPLLTKPSWIGYYNSICIYIYLIPHFDLKHEKGDHYVYHITFPKLYYIYIHISPNITQLCLWYLNFKFFIGLDAILQGPSQRRHSTLADAHVHDVHRWCFHVPWQYFFSPTEHAGEHYCHICSCFFMNHMPNFAHDWSLDYVSW